MTSDSGLVQGPEQSMFSARSLALLLVLILAISSLGAFCVASFLPREYRARAELLVPILPDGNTNSSNLQTQLAILSSASALQQVAFEMKRPVDEVADAVSSEQSGTSQIIAVLTKDDTQQGAMQLAQSLLNAYKNIVRSSSSTSGNVTYLEEQIASLEEQLDDLPSGSEAPSSASNARSIILARITALQDQLVAEQLSDVREQRQAMVITEPYPDTMTTFSRPLIAAGVGLLAGLGLDGLIAFNWIRRWKPRRHGSRAMIA